jgi:hypothetical protein
MALSLADVLATQRDSASFVLGTVMAAWGDGTVSVNIGGTTSTLPHLRAYVPGVNDTVLVIVQGSRLIVVDAITNPADPVAPRNPAPSPSQPTPTVPYSPIPTPTTQVVTFTANSVASYRGSSWRTDRSEPIQGDYGGYGLNTGCWFYGTKVYDALKGAEVLGLKVYMKRVSGGDFSKRQGTIWAHNAADRPSGAPSLIGGSNYAIAGLATNTAGWVDYPTWIGQAFSDGNAKGIACYIGSSTPYIVYASLASSRSSGALQFTYRR